MGILSFVVSCQQEEGSVSSQRLVTCGPWLAMGVLFHPPYLVQNSEGIHCQTWPLDALSHVSSSSCYCALSSLAA